MEHFKLVLVANSVKFLKKKNTGKRTYKIEVEDGVLEFLRHQYNCTGKFVLCDQLILDFGLVTKHFTNEVNFYELKCLELKLNKGRSVCFATKDGDKLKEERLRTSDFVTARLSQTQINTFELNESDDEFVRNYA